MGIAGVSAAPGTGAFHSPAAPQEAWDDGECRHTSPARNCGQGMSGAACAKLRCGDPSCSAGVLASEPGGRVGCPPPAAVWLAALRSSFLAALHAPEKRAITYPCVGGSPVLSMSPPWSHKHILRLCSSRSITVHRTVPNRDRTFPECPPAHKHVGLWHGMGSHLCHHTRCHGNGQELR